MIYDDILEAVGDTPLVRLNRVVPAGSARVLAKFEGMTGGPAYDLDAIMSYLRAQEESGRIGVLSVVEARRAELELGSAKCLNVVLLGAAARSGTLGLSVEDVRLAVHERVPERFWELNDHALAWG